MIFLQPIQITCSWIWPQGKSVILLNDLYWVDWIKDSLITFFSTYSECCFFCDFFSLTKGQKEKTTTNVFLLSQDKLTVNQNYNKILESDWLSTGPIWALIGQCKNSRWRFAGNSNAKTTNIPIKIFGTLKLSFYFFQKNNYIIDFTSNDLTLIFYNSGGSL